MRCIINECKQTLRISAKISKCGGHRFPQNRNLRNKWLKAIQVLTGQHIDDEKTPVWRVCSKHFKKSDYQVADTHKLVKSAIPTVFTNTQEETEQLEILFSEEELSESEGTSSQRKRICFKNIENDITPEKAHAQLPRLQIAHNKLLKSRNRLYMKCRRLQKRVESMEQILSEAQRQNMISQHANDHLKMCFEDKLLLNELSKPTGKGRKYSDELKSFAVTLHYYSPRAYEYVRKSFNNALPSPRSIVRWYQSVDGEPGITTESLAALQALASELREKGERLLVSLMFDEVSIKQHMQWNHYTKTFEGSVQFAGYLPEASEDVPLAKDALVFMVSGVNRCFKIPIGYFLIKSIDADQKSVLIENILVALHEIGVTVISLIFDGLNANFSTVSTLGASLKIDENFQTHFYHLCTDEPVYVILDISHMLKLVRNTLAAKGVIKTENGFVRWEYIEKLNELQNLKGLKIAGKLSNRHINFKNEKMRVSLATETLSRSVAFALEERKNDKEFKGCEETIKFIRIFNDLFDIFTSKHSDAKGFKRPMNRDNINEYKSFFDTAVSYIKGLQIQQERKGTVTWSPVVQSINKTGFVGFLTAISSFTGMYDRHVEQLGELDEIHCYRHSQDHLETFFAAIRSKGGNNNNPTASQFKAAYKRLIRNNDVTVSAYANCTNFDDTKMLHAEEKCLFYLNTINGRPDFSNDDTDDTENSNEKQENEIVSVVTVDDNVLDNDLRNLASQVQQKLTKQIKCEACLCEIIRDSTEVQVNKEILKICKIAETEFRILTNGKTDFNISKHYNTLSNRINLQTFGTHPNIFSTLSEHILGQGSLSNHRNCLIKLCTDLCLKIRIEWYAKNMTGMKESIRSKLTKLILFRGD